MDSPTPAFDWMLRNQKVLRRVRREAFYGPSCQFKNAVEELAIDRAARNQLGQGTTITADQFCALSNDSRIEQLARLWLADRFNAAVLTDQLTHPHDTRFDTVELKPRNDEKGWYARTLKWLAANGLTLGSSAWSIAHWRTLGFVNDLLNQSDQPLQETATERTPLFLAGEQSGRVLWLVVDRMPGPPVITPHWWRLGQVPLGDNEQLLLAIQRGIQVVLAANSARFHARWWLEEYPGGNGWHDEIDEADSAQVAAACATLALCEPQKTESVLDAKVGVSGRLPDGELTRQLSTVEIENVTREAMKAETAKRAGLQCIVFAPQSAERGKAAIGESDYFSIHDATTLGEAFESLRLTSTAIRQVKTHTVQCWGNAHLETATDDIYVQLSEPPD